MWIFPYLGAIAHTNPRLPHFPYSSAISHTNARSPHRAGKLQKNPTSVPPRPALTVPQTNHQPAPHLPCRHLQSADPQPIKSRRFHGSATGGYRHHLHGHGHGSIGLTSRPLPGTLPPRPAAGLRKSPTGSVTQVHWAGDRLERIHASNQLTQIPTSNDWGACTASATTLRRHRRQGGQHLFV